MTADLINLPRTREELRHLSQDAAIEAMETMWDAIEELSKTRVEALRLAQDYGRLKTAVLSMSECVTSQVWETFEEALQPHTIDVKWYTFKESGKFYSEGVVTVPNARVIQDILPHVRQAVDARHEFTIVCLEFVGHPNAHPVMLRPTP